MLRTLFESRAQRTRRTGGTLASIAAHVGTIGLAVVVTAHATPAPPHANPTVEPVIFTAPVERVRGAAGASAPSPSAFPLARISLPLIAPSAIPLHLPAINPRTIVADSDWFNRPSAAASGGGHDHGSGPTSGLWSGAYDASRVDRPVEALDDNPIPRYPESLRAAHLEGAVEAQFIVDSTGRVEPGSITILNTNHPLFADAVRRSLLASRYRPAEAHGARVRQIVEQRFEFTLGK
ncbi:MAG TPA: energy transducer TonB [Gemmatimonadaceae bacterium]